MVWLDLAGLFQPELFSSMIPCYAAFLLTVISAKLSETFDNKVPAFQRMLWARSARRQLTQTRASVKMMMRESKERWGMMEGKKNILTNWKRIAIGSARSSEYGGSGAVLITRSLQILCILHDGRNSKGGEGRTVIRRGNSLPNPKGFPRPETLLKSCVV